MFSTRSESDIKNEPDEGELKEKNELIADELKGKIDLFRDSYYEILNLSNDYIDQCSEWIVKKLKLSYPIKQKKYTQRYENE